VLRLFGLLALPVLLLKNFLRPGCAALLMLLASLPTLAQTGAGNDVDPGGPMRCASASASVTAGAWRRRLAASRG
jgi:hypothetical protein